MADGGGAMSLGTQVSLSEPEFRQLQALFYERVGIQLPPVKKPLICGRLSKRLTALGLEGTSRWLIETGDEDGTVTVSQRSIA